MKFLHPGFLLVTIVIFSDQFNVVAQDSEPSQFTTQVSPMTPNAAALAKYVDVPVSYYTGTPQISVPLYELKSGSLSVPIALSYHASGNRVSDAASNVGLGWTLIAGGSISRSVRGLPDEASHGYLSEGRKINNPYFGCNGDPGDHCDYLRNISVENAIDSEPDVFFLSLPAGEGVKFVFDYNGNIVMQNYQQIQITKDAAMLNWTVITEDGTRYKFGRTGIYGGRDSTSVTLVGAGFRTYPSAWHLSQVISPDRQDTISFGYKWSSQYQFDDPKQEIIYQKDVYATWMRSHVDPNIVNCPDKPHASFSPGSTAMVQRMISKISTRHASVEFFLSPNTRYDLIGDRSLDSIAIRRTDASIIKTFGLKHGYFGKNSEENTRLKLSKVIEYSAAGSSLPPYEFYYNEKNSLPPRDSYKQDHWGYYNNNPAQTFIPKTVYSPGAASITFANGGNRDTDSTLVKTGMLTKIVYPEGGFDVFEFEANDIYQIGGQVAKEPYDETYKFRASTYARKASMVIDTIFAITATTSASISVGGACHGLCGWKGNCEKAAASASFGGIGVLANYNNMGWGCLSTPRVTEVLLVPGQYTINVQADWIAPEVYSNAYVEVTLHKFRDAAGPSYFPVGGVRIKRIKRYSAPGTQPIVRRFRYKTTKGGYERSSGVLVRTPLYYGNVVAQGWTPVSSDLICYYQAGYSESRVSFGEGTHIGYSEVKVLQGERGENGYEIFKYTTALDWPDSGEYKFPNPPFLSRDNRRGRLIEHSIYDKDNNPVAKTFNSYQLSYAYRKSAKGLKAGMVIPRRNDYFPDDYSVAGYYFRQEWHYPDTVRERVYSSTHDGSFTEVTTRNYFDRTLNHTQMTMQDVSQSDGSWLRTSFKYPQDYGVSKELANINRLVTRHIYSPPIEIQTWKLSSAPPLLLAGRITDFDSVTAKPSKAFALNTRKPLNYLDHEVRVGEKFNTLLSDSGKYELRAKMSYNQGKVISQTKDNGTPNSYVWGYNNTQPIAEASNADAASIAYTGFEIRSDGNWIIPSKARENSGFTGLKSYSLSNGNITKTGLDASKSYTISFWSKVGTTWVNSKSPVAVTTVNGWTLNVITATGSSITISGNALIDDLRLHPVDAQMTSYTYDPPVGVTSVMDANNRVTYYEYDGFQRLSLIKDFSGNILKRYTYNYATR